MNSKFPPINLSRRDFLRTSAVASLTAMAGGLNKAYAAGSDKIRVGVLGCGGRGIYDSSNCVNSAENVEIVAVGDLFQDHIDSFLEYYKTNLPAKINVTPETCFTGFDACQKVLACDIDLIMLTQTPHFRPMHFRAAVEAGKHVFMEKPVAVDPVGVRSVIETAQLADQQKLTVLAGTQMRRIAHLVDIMKHIHDGELGQITSGQCYRLGDGMMGWGPMTRDPQWSDMEWQIRRWEFFTWLSGDFIVEQHVHNLDLINRALNAHPVQCTILGGRQARTDPMYGDVYDHFAGEFEYPDGVRIDYSGAQIDRISGRCDQRIFGSKGVAFFDFSRALIEGQNPYEYKGEIPDPCLRQHADQIDAIRTGKPLNEAVRIAESTLTAIMGRMSAYTGKSLKWDWVMKASKLDLTPPAYDFIPLPEPVVAVPGVTPLV